MNWNFSKLIDLFSTDHSIHLLNKGKWGLEKESLRITGDGKLAFTPHPIEFGNKTENPYIKTDFSESQIELVTPAFNSIDKTFSFLNNLQIMSEQIIENELLWPLSMPCRLPDDKAIPIALYNDTEEGKEKEIYRSGLALRYGKKMQMISGIHYNFSFSEDFWDFLYHKTGAGKTKPAFINEAYFTLARNFLRYRWLLYYLFGASPIADESYWTDTLKKNKELDMYPDNATSLRMSRFGYDNGFQSSNFISYNSLKDYLRDIRTALTTKSEVYLKFGMFRNGRQIQLNDNLLQLENEYYSPIRFKQLNNKGERQIDALEKKGVQYIELRVFDINPFEKTGISLEQMYFIHSFIVFCLFENNDFISEQEERVINSNSQLVALGGRKNGIILTDNNNQNISLQEWGKIIFIKLKTISKLLDKNSFDNKYGKSTEAEYKKLFNISLLPSSKIINEMCGNNESYTEFGVRNAIVNSAPYDAGSEPLNIFFCLSPENYNEWKGIN
jgi:glutamate--cysteine ligase